MSWRRADDSSRCALRGPHPFELVLNDPCAGIASPYLRGSAVPDRPGFRDRRVLLVLLEPLLRLVALGMHRAAPPSRAMRTASRAALGEITQDRAAGCGRVRRSHDTAFKQRTPEWCDPSRRKFGDIAQNSRYLRRSPTQGDPGVATRVWSPVLGRNRHAGSAGRTVRACGDVRRRAAVGRAARPKRAAATRGCARDAGRFAALRGPGMGRENADFREEL